MEAMRVTRPRRAIVAALVMLSLLPLGAANPARADCDPAIPPEVCNLLPTGVDTLPIDQTAVVGRTYVPANPAVKSGGYLYLHNFDTSTHFWVFANGHFKRLAPGEFGPRGQKFHISVANGFVPNASYTFTCTLYPEMTGELTVTP